MFLPITLNMMNFEEWQKTLSATFTTTAEQRQNLQSAVGKIFSLLCCRLGSKGIVLSNQTLAFSYLGTAAINSSSFFNMRVLVVRSSVFTGTRLTNTCSAVRRFIIRAKVSERLSNTAFRALFHLFIILQESNIGWLVNQLADGNNIPLRLEMSSCENADKIKLVGEQHERFEDTIPSD